MSMDAFGNSPAMTEEEMVEAGLIDEDGQITPKGQAWIDDYEASTTWDLSE